MVLFVEALEGGEAVVVEPAVVSIGLERAAHRDE